MKLNLQIWKLLIRLCICFCKCIKRKLLASSSQCAKKGKNTCFDLINIHILYINFFYLGIC